VPGVLVAARPVAVVHMVDGGEADEKVIAVPIEDPRFDIIKDIGDINPHTLREIEHFFLTYKKLQKKEVTISNIEGREAAEKAIEEGLDLYKAKYK
jgi:inorganic pyrophosphatase